MMDPFFAALDHAHKVQHLASLQRLLEEVEQKINDVEQDIIADGPLSCSACRRRAIVVCEHIGGDL
jgi:hypothetical protein